MKHEMKHELKAKIISTITTQDHEKMNEIAECLSDMIEDAMEHLEQCDTKMYSHMNNKLHILINGEHLNEDMACDWINKMFFDKGQPMTKEQTDALAKQAGVDFNSTNFNCWDWYAVVNMAVSTMFDYASTAEDYSDFALGFFKDPSAKQGKAYNYYTHIVK